ncbi:hypothetical protein [Almyronema epifaneia]|uniref:hypothetical protein n=1 Tax=Almyronema epifaneia TaxID=3114805 RepID=UPI00366EF525
MQRSNLAVSHCHIFGNEQLSRPSKGKTSLADRSDRQEIIVYAGEAQVYVT